MPPELANLAAAIDALESAGHRVMVRAVVDNKMWPRSVYDPPETPRIVDAHWERSVTVNGRRTRVTPELLAMRPDQIVAALLAGKDGA